LPSSFLGAALSGGSKFTGRDDARVFERNLVGVTSTAWSFSGGFALFEASLALAVFTVKTSKKLIVVDSDCLGSSSSVCLFFSLFFFR